ncbi:hypothetical protein [Planctomycetes bacterium Pan216]
MWKPRILPNSSAVTVFTFASLLFLIPPTAASGQDRGSHEPIYPKDRVFSLKDIRSAIMMRSLASDQQRIEGLSRMLRKLADKFPGLADKLATNGMSGLDANTRQRIESIARESGILDQLRNNPSMQSTLLEMAKRQGFGSLNGENPFGGLGQKLGQNPDAGANLRNLLKKSLGQDEVPRANESNRLSQLLESIAPSEKTGNRGTDARSATRETSRPQRPRRLPKGLDASASEWMLDFARDLKRSGTTIAQSSALERAIEDLEMIQSGQQGLSVDHLIPDSVQDSALRAFANNADWLGDAMVGSSDWLPKAGKVAASSMPDLSWMPRVRLPKTPKGLFPRFSIPKISLPEPPSLEFGLPSLPSAPSGGAIFHGIAYVIIALGVLAGAVWLFRHPVGWRPGGLHGTKLFSRRNAKSPREKVRAIFESAAIDQLGDDVRSQHHHQITTSFNKRLYNETDLREDASGSVEPPVPATSPASNLASLYEKARYSPPNEPFGEKEVEKAVQNWEILANFRNPQLPASNGRSPSRADTNASEPPIT